MSKYPPWFKYRLLSEAVLNSNSCTLDDGGNACSIRINDTAELNCTPYCNDAVAGHLNDNELLGSAADPLTSKDVSLDTTQEAVP